MILQINYGSVDLNLLARIFILKDKTFLF